VRVNGIVHVQSKLAPGEMVPIGWVAVGNPAHILPPQEHDKIWELQEPLNFPRTVYALERSEATMTKLLVASPKHLARMRRMSSSGD
jgi:hypothetical protein